MRIIEASELAGLAQRPVPNHIAIIMDGNRRWAIAHGLEPSHAYEGVAPAIISTLREAVRIELRQLTFFALSINNLSRHSEELAPLLQFESWLWTAEVQSVVRELDILPRIVTARPELVEHLPVPDASQSAGLRLNMCVAYSGREAIRTGVGANGADGSRILEDVDLLIRTGGEVRLSDFLLWESAQAELLFTDTLWPDFTGLHLASAVWDYQGRRRRFGL